MTADHRERAFEEAIERAIIADGFESVPPASYDRAAALFTDVALAFIQETQPMAWKRLLEVHGGSDGVLQQFGDRLAKQLDERGTVDVLRHGLNDHGIEVRLAFPSS